MDSDNAPTDFADTLKLPLHELPGAADRFLPPHADAAAAAEPRAALPVAGLPVATLPVAVAVAARPPTPIAESRPAVPRRRATDAGTGLVARFSLHRRRSTDPTRALDAVGASTAPPSPPRAVIEPPPAPQSALCLFVRGFNDTEKKLLEGTVRLSQRRVPRLSLVPEADAALADVVMIDGLDAEAVTWAAARPWLARKKLIWIDSQLPRPGHMEARRPVQWPLLPMLLARALEHGRGAQPQPVPTAMAPAAAAGTRQAAPAGISRVLVVDDSLAVRSHLRSLLEARGMQVSDATCVGEALAALAAAPAGHFICALMDVLMPDMDGYEGCRRIKAAKASLGPLPVLMLTSKSSPFDRIRGKMAGCDAYLTKPVEPALLYAALSPYQAASAAPVHAPATPAAAHRFASTGRG